MPRNQNSDLWTDPSRDMPLRYHHLSYIIFRSDSGDAAILGSRCPEPDRFAVGMNLVNALRLDEETQAYLFGPRAESPLVIKTAVGVGILDKRYHRYAGIGIYWHIHGETDALSRLVNSGVLGSAEGGRYSISRAVAAVKGKARYSDSPSYEALADAWSYLEIGPEERVRCDEKGCLYIDEVVRMAEDLASIVGCSLRWKWEEDSGGVPCRRVNCRYPVLLEAIMLCLLSEASTCSAADKVSGLVRPLGNEEGLGVVLELSYPVERPEKFTEEWDSVRRHVLRLGDLYGMAFRDEVIRLKRGERQAGKLPSREVILEWLYDPAVLPTSDLKAKTKLEDED